LSASWKRKGLIIYKDWDVNASRSRSKLTKMYREVNSTVDTAEVERADQNQ
jgi:5S rRNA maturation endonuclease (ribonuclease M5)